jgi:hypothetical protein
MIRNQTPMDTRLIDSGRERQKDRDPLRLFFLDRIVKESSDAFIDLVRVVAHCDRTFVFEIL